MTEQQKSTNAKAEESPVSNAGQGMAGTDRRGTGSAQEIAADPEVTREIAGSAKNPAHFVDIQTQPSRFQPGELVARRFQVIRLIGRGGMGEVYEVTDDHLHGVHIALKTLLPEIARDPAMRKSFEREVLLARSLTHPNVCPIYDIFHGEETEEPLLFLTMKLLPGETLSAELRKRNKLPLIEAMPVIRQIAAGLSAAHAAGIIHRDIKTSNIILNATGEGVHVWVTDFGLARLYQGETTIFNQPVLAGTPGYIAPELYEGRPATVASDVYAFGVVVQKILTEPPGGQDLHLQETGSVGVLPKPWKALIARCVEPDPSKRFQSIDEAMATVESEGAKTGGLALSRRQMLALSTGVAAAAVGGTWFGVHELHSGGPPLPEKRFVALLAWPVAPPEDVPVVASLLDSIGHRLARAEAYVKNLLIISSPDINSAPTYTASPSSLVTSLGANLALAASLSHSKVLTTLTLQVLVAETSQVLRKGSISILPNALAGLADKAANLAANLLDLPRDISLKDPDELQRVSASTYRLFSEAEELAAQPNYAGLDAAIAKYQEALNENPHFALCYAQLSMAYTRQYLRYHEPASLRLADSNATLALQYNPQSARGLLSKALFYLYSGKTDQALDYIAKALQADPENPETLLYKGRAFAYLNRWQDEEVVYRQILRNRPNFWPAHNELGFILAREARYDEAAKEFDEAAVVAPRVALPLANLGTMYAEMGRTADAVEALTKSLQRSPNEVAYMTLGDIAFSAGHYKEALADYSKAKDLNLKNDAAWRNLGDTYAVLSRPALMKESYSTAATILSERLKANPSSGSDWMTLAFYHAKIGDAAAAQEDLKTAEARGATDLESQFTKAQALALLGEKEDALQLLLTCLNRGLSPVEINLAIDLKDVTLDPRYKSAVERLHPHG
jgi:eukaryotic-like serine/threonine-protein kinase